VRNPIFNSSIYYVIAASRRLGTIEEHNNACFVVKDATGQALGYFYFEMNRIGAN
jgi:hypothetical protein